ncbi:hypothetical protein H0H87_008454 [Tephrocybe sp. NHM501043]|nr:hypothetical protein H0H87_008454 [Tephrocybe sp. NHM501043]
MSSDPIREIVVDDTDSQLSYKGNWKVDNGTILDNVGLYGPIFNETSHGASESGSSVNFSFVGTSITVYGTNQTLPDFGWECLIDNVRVIDMPKPPQVDNNWKLCGATSMREDTHSIAINVLSASNSGTLWIDYFRYTPLANATFNGDVTIHVPSSDPGIKYSAGWSTFGAFASVELAHYSQSLNANVEFTFVGEL